MTLKRAMEAALAVAALGTALGTDDCAEGVCSTEEAAMLQTKAMHSSLTINNQQHALFATFTNYNVVPGRGRARPDPSFAFGGTILETSAFSATEEDAPAATVGQRLSWRLRGVDPRCERGPGHRGGSCSIRVKSGFSCDSPDEYGEDLWNDEARLANSWNRLTYTPVVKVYFTTSASPALTRMLEQEILSGVVNVVGRAVVVHDFDGTPMACSIFRTLESLITSSSDSDRRLATCIKSVGASEEGMQSCMERAMQDSTVDKENDEEKQQIFFHRPKYCVDHWTPFPGYTGNGGHVQGSVQIEDASWLGRRSIAAVGHSLTWRLSNVDGECRHGPDESTKFSCGIHITRPLSCEVEDPDPEPDPESEPSGESGLGAPYSISEFEESLINTEARVTDNTEATSYTSTDLGQGEGGGLLKKGRSSSPTTHGRFVVLTGVPLKETKHHAVVVRDKLGLAFACGIVRKGPCAHHILPGAAHA